MHFFLAYIITAWKRISIWFYLSLSYFSHVDGVYFIVFNLSYQAFDLNINNNPFPSELHELLDNSCVYGIHTTCVVLARNGGYHIWSTWVIWAVFAQAGTHRHEVSASTQHWSEKIHTVGFCCVSRTLSQLAPQQAADTYFGISTQNSSGQHK